MAVVSMIGAASHAAAQNKAEYGTNNPAGGAANSAADEAGKNARQAEQYPADNSGKNARDANDAAVTAEDQSNSKVDMEITQAIRKAVTADDSLSVNAHNVKIITNGGVVTLRGPVKSEQERASIAKKAQEVSGVTRVNNQLEVAAQ